MRLHSGLKSLLLFTMMLFSHASQAIEPGWITGKIGTLGVGIEYNLPLNKYFSVGVGLNTLKFEHEIEQGDVEYKATLNLKSYALTGRYHPWGSSFHLHAGVLKNKNYFSVSARPKANTYTFNDEKYQASDVGSASGKIKFRDYSPFVGLGWSLSPKGKNKLFLDVNLGLLFQKSPQVSLSVLCGATLPDEDCKDLKADVEKERVKFDEDIKDFKFYPIASIGLSYRF